jgi:hypothetical protein
MSLTLATLRSRAGHMLRQPYHEHAGKLLGENFCESFATALLVRRSAAARSASLS